MLIVTPSIPEHFYNLEIQEAQAFYRKEFEANPEYATTLIKYGISRTGLDENGNVIGIMGLIFRHENCAEAWALFSPYIRLHIRSIVTEVKKFLAEHSHIQRIHCTASIDFPQAHKLLTTFGFRAESILEKWDAFGNDHIMYVKINNIDWETR